MDGFETLAIALQAMLVTAEEQMQSTQLEKLKDLKDLKDLKPLET